MSATASRGHDQLRGWLGAAGLAEYHIQLVDRGVTEQNFVHLQIHDFPRLGVQPRDRQQFHQLIEAVRIEMSNARDSSPEMGSPERYSPPSPQSDGFEVHSVEDEEGSPRDLSPPSKELPSNASCKKTPRTKAKIRVVVRKRPLNKREVGREESDVVSADREAFTVMVHEPKVKVDMTKYIERHEFVFDDVFDENVSNAELYEYTARPLVAAAFEGAKATCFAYGQTGSGKTHTMMGPDTISLSDGDSSKEQGLYAMAAHDLFAHLKSRANSNLCVNVSFFEIYGGKLFDLLNGRKLLVAREDRKQAVCIVGLQHRECDSVNSLLQLIKAGSQIRSTGSTGANIDSSRSHAILQITLCQKNSSRKMVGRLSFIDLAGSERGVDTVNTDKRTRIEGAEINKSLLALKECIRAQDQNHKHTPFRGSKLTQVLKDSFVGNCRTVMVANISPNSGSCEHTLNTLRYADRVKELKKLDKSHPARNAYMPHRVSTPAVVLPALASSSSKEFHAESFPVQESAMATITEEGCDDIRKVYGEYLQDTYGVLKEEMDLMKRLDVADMPTDQHLRDIEGLIQRKLKSISSMRHQLYEYQKSIRHDERFMSSV